MLAAVIDTNVTVSAMISGQVRAPTQIIDAWRESRFTWITSPSLIAELERAMLYPQVRRIVKWSDEKRDALVASLRSAAVIVDPAIRITNVVRDPKDAHVLEAAVAGRADYIVSGDNDLLVLARYEAVEIVTPAAFVAMLSR